MKKYLNATVFAGILAAVFTVQAQAAEQASTAASKSGAAALLDDLYMNYFGVFHGPSIKDPSSPHAVDRNGDVNTKSGVNLDGDLYTAYKVAPGYLLGVDVPFLASPVLGQGFTLGDVGIEGADTAVYNSNGLLVYANLILQAPTSKGSQARDMSFAVKTTPFVRWSVPGSRFVLGAWTEAKDYLGVTAFQTFKLYGQPYVSYRLTPSLALNVGYEVEAHHNVGDPGVDFSMWQQDLLPGVVWNITPSILVNPYLQVFTTSQASADRTALGAVVNFRVL